MRRSFLFAHLLIQPSAVPFTFYYCISAMLDEGTGTGLNQQMTKKKEDLRNEGGDVGSQGRGSTQLRGVVCEETR